MKLSLLIYFSGLSWKSHRTRLWKAQHGSTEERWAANTTHFYSDHLYCNLLRKSTSCDHKLSSEVEINRQRQFHSKQTSTQKGEHSTENPLCAGSQEKQCQRSDHVFHWGPWTFQEVTAKFKGWNFIIFHEFSGKTSSFPSTPSDDSEPDPEKQAFSFGT